MRLAASEKAGDSREKASASLLARSSVCLGNLFLKRRDSTLGIRDGLLHHENALGEQVGSRRNLSDLAANQLISLGVFRLATRLAQSIKQTGYEIAFFWCHRDKEDVVPHFDKFQPGKFN